jgi:hypothetical protein
MNAWVDTVVDVVRKVKKDNVVANIMARFGDISAD